MKKKKKEFVKDADYKCKHCSGVVKRYKHTESWKPKESQKHYFEFYDICCFCDTIYLKEEFKRNTTEFKAVITDDLTLF